MTPRFDLQLAGSQPGRRLKALLPQLQYALTLLFTATVVLDLFELVGFVVIGHDQSHPWYVHLVTQGTAITFHFGPIVLAVVLIDALAPPRSHRWLWMALALPLCCLAGQLLTACLLKSADLPALWHHRRDVASQALLFCFPGALLLAIYEFHCRSLHVVEEAYTVHAARIALQEELGRARLQTLRAQIEPHFLFNTLANVRRLYRIDPGSGRELMDRVIHYLASALPSMRREHSTLREEAALISAYLDIYRIRMGTRLAYDIVFPESLLNLSLPPMMLLTLVENAIKHGLAPLPEGGRVRVSALARDGILELRVADSGRGFAAGSGCGCGLGNIRSRLHGLYGDSASLSLSLNQPRGVVAMLRLPLPAAGAAA